MSKKKEPELIGGYDLKQVPKMLCFACGKPIGKKPWREVTILARFGQMLFEHKKC